VVPAENLISCSYKLSKHIPEKTGASAVFPVIKIELIGSHPTSATWQVSAEKTQSLRSPSIKPAFPNKLAEGANQGRPVAIVSDPNARAIKLAHHFNGCGELEEVSFEFDDR
jgi:hypothetical protein